MGQFKPMVKMETTEPSVILKLKKGGHVMSMDAAKAEDGYKSMSKANGGMMGGMLDRVKPMISSARQSSAIVSPKKPSMADRARSMRSKGQMARPAMQKASEMARPALREAVDPSAPMRGPRRGRQLGMMGGLPAMAAKAMKHGGESKATHASEMKKMSGLKKELMSHEGKPASKAHKGLKTGGVVNGQGGFKTGGVIKGNAGGYKDGGDVHMMPDGKMMKNSAMKKGGATKKFADGGAVQDNGRAVKMPQGNKRPSTPVSINQLSGTFKKGGKVNKYADGGDAQTKKNERDYDQYEKDEKRFNESLRDDVMSGLTYPFRKIKEMFSDSPARKGSVTKTKESVTVAKKSGGKC